MAGARLGRFFFLAALGGTMALWISPGFGENSVRPPAALTTIRDRGDADAQRRHVWTVIAGMTGGDKPLFESWHGEDALFGASTDASPEARGIRGFARTAAPTGALRTDVPVITYTLYNDTAYDHIKRNGLNRVAVLDRLRKSGKTDDTVTGNRAVPAFPASAMVVKTAWWPIAKEGLTALPVWDPQTNPPARGGNPYIGWARVVAVDPSRKPGAGQTAAMEFAGRSFAAAHSVGLEAFYHVTVDAALARRMMRDPESRKAVLIGLGRPLAAGDHLVLVAANLATRELPDWIWASFWWHDDAGRGAFAAGRPAMLKSEWRNYLMQTTFDTKLPRADDGGPNVSFDPWLEGRFPDGGHGGGAVSNCLACHQRASYPAVRFLPVTRGAPDLRRDPAFAPGRLRTAFLWSIAMHPRP